MILYVLAQLMPVGVGITVIWKPVVGNVEEVDVMAILKNLLTVFKIVVSTSFNLFFFFD